MDPVYLHPAIAVLTVVQIVLVLALTAASIAGSYYLSKSAKKSKPLAEGDQPTTLSFRGAYAPLVVGRRRVGPIFAWSGRRGSFNRSSGSGKSKQRIPVTFEAGWHILCIGPAEKLHAIYQSGELIWEGPIERNTTPSGSQIEIPNQGTFFIYWGELTGGVASPVLATPPGGDFKDTTIPVASLSPGLTPTNFPLRPNQSVIWNGTDPTFVLRELISSPSASQGLGINSTFPGVCHIVWNAKILTGTTWPQLDYEIEVRPFNTGLLGLSVDWLETQIGDPQRYKIMDRSFGGSPGNAEITVREDLSTLFQIGNLIDIVDEGAADGIYTINSIDYSTNNIPTAELLDSFENASYVDDFSTEQFMSDQPIVPVTPPAILPGVDVYDLQVPDNLIGDMLQWTLPGNSSFLFAQPEFSVLGPVDHQHQVDFIIKLQDLFNGGDPSLSDGTEGGFGGSSTNYVVVAIYDESLFQHYFIKWEWTPPVTLPPNDPGGIVLSPGFWSQSSSGAPTGASLPDGDTIDQGDDWWRLSIRITVEAATEGDSFFVEVVHSRPVYMADFVIRETEGTTIVPLENLVGLADADQHGTIGLASTPNQFDGANPAYLLAQLLFAPAPHGANLDPSCWDVNKLDDLAIFYSQGFERLPSHIHIRDGEPDLQGLIGGILQDLGLMISWDMEQAHWTFVPVRQELNPTNLLADTLQDDIPVITTIVEDNGTSRLVFSYPDRERAYRSSTIAEDDSGQLSGRIAPQHKVTEASLMIVTDYVAAIQVGSRRSQEELSKVTSLEVKAMREARKLLPGTVFTVPNIPEQLRLLSVDIEEKTDLCKLSAIVDSYGDAVRSTLTFTGSSPGAGSPSPATPPEPDLQFTFLELNRYFATSSFIAVPRIRSSQAVSSADLWLSRDNVTYEQVGNDSEIFVGGTLRVPFGDTDPYFLDFAPLFDIVGPDSEIQDLSPVTSREAWLSGQQLLLIGEEILYVRSINDLGGGIYQLLGVVRARFGTSRGDHSPGDEIYIIPQADVSSFESTLLIPGKQLYVKTQPLTSTSTPLSAVTPVQKTLTGAGERPLNPGALRTTNMSNSYLSGQDIELKWSYRSITYSRTGAGQQGAGDPVSLASPVEGSFDLQILDDMNVVLRTVTGLTVGEYSYLNADLVSDFSGEPNLLRIQVRNVLGSLQSEWRQIEVELNS